MGGKKGNMNLKLKNEISMTDKILEDTRLNASVTTRIYKKGVY